MRASKFGDWTRAGVVLQGLNVNIYPAISGQIKEDGDMILEKLVNHIDNQDLPWTPLSSKTIALKGGNNTIYVETGFLKNNLEVRKVKSSYNNVTFFVGASAWKRTAEGVKLSDLMIWLEYGTDKIPPRPLIRPTFEEVEDILKNNWRDIMSNLVKTGGV